MADLVFPGKTVGGPLNSGTMPSNYDLVIYKGDFVELFVTLKDSSNAAINLTGYTGKAQLKTSYVDSTPVNFTCTVTDASNGVIRIYLPSSTSSTLVPGSYIWDFQVTNTTPDTRTYLAGDVTVYDEVTTS